jgi:hypothetical protein
MINTLLIYEGLIEAVNGLSVSGCEPAGERMWKGAYVCASAFL